MVKPVVQPLFDQDIEPVARQRAATLPHRGLIDGPQGREGYDALLEQTSPPPDVRFESGVVAGVRGWWAIPARERSDARILFSHGGGYVLGTAKAFCKFAGHFSRHTRLRTFVADYPLAPEHRYPAPVDALWAVYEELARETPVVLVGDSAGGNACLVLAARAARKGKSVAQPVAVAVMSPWTDVGNTGESMQTRADADFIFTHTQLNSFARHYLGDRRSTEPDASPLYDVPEGLPPIDIHVGQDELLLDDSARYAERASEAGADISLTIWTGMPHVFQLNAGKLHAADQSIEAIAAFVTRRLASDER